MKIKYNDVDDGVISELKSIFGDEHVITEEDSLVSYSHDEYALEDVRHFPDAVVRPSSTEEVAAVVRLCNEKRIPLTARGGGTGLCGGCVPSHGGIVMVFDRMNRVLEIDRKNLIAVVEAGVRLMEFYPSVESEGLFFPPHPGDETACFGGLVATNAGGARAVKYGVIRNYIRGLEVVTPQGEIVTLGGKFLKDSSGYSLMHLLIGSEGTLGIVTKVYMTLMPPPKIMYTLVAAYDKLQDAIDTVPSLIREKIIPMAIEFVDRETIVFSAESLQLDWPFSMGRAYVIMMIDGSSFDEIAGLCEEIQKICSEHKALDVLVADTPQKQRDILKIRSSIYEVMKEHVLEILDITVPRAAIADFVVDVQEVAEAFNMWLLTYGHAADGNVHIQIMKSRCEGGGWVEIEGWEKSYQPIREKLHALGKKYEGIPSGEHGIGIVKKGVLKSFLDEAHIDMMRSIKQSLDPNGILNPGKVFD